jgi:CRISPR-associated protein Csx14
MGVILIATLGTEAQVVTATLDLLFQRGVWIEEVIALHTALSDSPDELTSPIGSAVELLSEAFRTSPYHGRVRLTLVPFLDRFGKPLQDVDTPQATEAAFRCLYNQVRCAKQASHQVHLAISGGRKVLSLFAMSTAQLLCDEGDCIWYLHSAGDFLASKRLHPQPGDQVQLIPVPFLLWSQVSPVLSGLGEVEDPYEALKKARNQKLAERREQARSYLLGSLTPAELRVVSALAQEGLTDHQIAERLSLSPRTVEQHLRSAFIKAANHWELPSVTRAQLIVLLTPHFALE